MAVQQTRKGCFLTRLLSMSRCIAFEEHTAFLWFQRALEVIRPPSDNAMAHLSPSSFQTDSQEFKEKAFLLYS